MKIFSYNKSTRIRHILNKEVKFILMIISLIQKERKWSQNIKLFSSQNNAIKGRGKQKFWTRFFSTWREF